MPSYSPLYAEAIAQFDTANAADPNQEEVDGQLVPKELLYAQRMTAALEWVYPDASEALALAARAQHIKRWESPRSDYPSGKAGYKQWRKDLYLFHANTATAILQHIGYDADTIDQVGRMLRKEKIKQNEEVQRLEDVICVVFLEHYLEAFVAKHQYDEDKLTNILRKTWAKMSAHGHQAALSLSFPTNIQQMLAKIA